MGWDGENSSADTIKEWDGTAFREVATPIGVPSGGEFGQALANSTLASPYQISFPRNVITTDGTDLLISNGPTIAPAVGGPAPDDPGVAYAPDGVTYKSFSYPDAGYSVSHVLTVNGLIWAIVEDRTTRDLWWHQLTISGDSVLYSGSRIALTRPGGTQQTELWGGTVSGTRVYLAFGDAAGRLVRYDGTTTPPTPVVNSPDALSDPLSPRPVMFHDPVLGRLYHAGTTGLIAFDENTLLYVGSLHWGYAAQAFPVLNGQLIKAPIYGFASDGTKACFIATRNVDDTQVLYYVDAIDLVSNVTEATLGYNGFAQGLAVDLANNLAVATTNSFGSPTYVYVDLTNLGAYSSNNFPVLGTNNGDMTSANTTQSAVGSFVAGKFVFPFNAAADSSGPYEYPVYLIDWDGVTLSIDTLGKAGVLDWVAPDEILMEAPLPSDIHVDVDTGSDDNDGLTSGTALATLGEARRRIGDKNGDVTIWLWGAVGTTYTITYDNDLDRLWHAPRKGYGSLTIRSTVTETVATLNATAYDNQIFLVSQTPGMEEYDGNFIALGSDQPMDNNDGIVLRSDTGFAGMIWTSYPAFLPSPNTLTIWRPGIILDFGSPAPFHGGNSTIGGIVELINLRFNPTKVEGGGLSLKWVQVGSTQYWTNVAFTNTSRVLFGGSQYFEDCTTHGSSSLGFLDQCVFGTPEFYRCGAAGVSGTFSQGSPFQIWNARMYVTDIHSSDMVLNYIVCTGDILGEVHNSNISMSVRPVQIRNISLLSRSSLNLTVDDLPSTAMGIYSGSTAVGYVYLRDSRMNVTWNNNPNPTLFGLPNMENSHVRVNKDISAAVGVPQLSFSNSTDGYLLADGSFIGRENSVTTQASAVGKNSSGAFTNYVSSRGPIDRQDHYGPILDGDAGTYSFTLPANREFTVKVLVAGSSNASPSVRYAVAYLVKGSTDGGSVISSSEAIQWGSTDDDLTIDPLSDIAVTFGDSGLDLQVTVANNIGSNLRLTASVYFEPEHFTAPTPPDPLLTPNPTLDAYSGLTFLYDYSGFDTTVPGKWDPNVGLGTYPVKTLSGYTGNWASSGWPASLAAMRNSLASTVSGIQTFVAIGQFPSALVTARCIFSLTTGFTAGPSIQGIGVQSGNLVALTDSGTITLLALDPGYVDSSFVLALRLVSGDWYVSLRCNGNHDTNAGADVFTAATNLDTITIGARGDLAQTWGTFVAEVGGYTTAHTNGDLALISADAGAEYGIF